MSEPRAKKKRSRPWRPINLFEDEQQYIETWGDLERRAGRTFSHAERQRMRAEAVVFDRVSDHPGYPRRRIVFTYWDLFLRYLMQMGGKL